MIARIVPVLFVLFVFGISDTTKVYIAKTSKKYHRDTCSYLKKSKIEISRQDAIKYYKACRVCKPDSGK